MNVRDIFEPRLKRWSNHDQVDERKHGGADPDRDQGIVDPDVGIERRWVSLLVHGGISTVGRREPL